jgi:hypothetical protein
MAIAVIGRLGLAYWDECNESRKHNKSRQIQAELNELKKRVDEIQEQLAELYIRQHDDRASQLK